MERVDTITAKEVLDSRGNPTVEVLMGNGVHHVSAKIPSGRSAGSREALELRDPDGKGVSLAIEHVNNVIAPALRHMPLDPSAIDAKLLLLDRTPNKSQLGANAMLGVSMAAVKLSAHIENVPLWKYIAGLSGRQPSMPRLYMNMLNGGAHASFRLPFQEYIVVVGSESASRSYGVAQEIFAALGELVKRECGETPFGDEGGYAPMLKEIEKPFALLREASGGRGGTFFAIDAAASEFFRDGKYVVGDVSYSADNLFALYQSLQKEYGVKSIEDPFDERDFVAYERFVKERGDGLLIVGDDLTVTNPRIVQEMVDKKRANAIIIKPNQVGTISEVFETVDIAVKAGWKLIASHRSGETDDTFIADLAVGIGAYGLKAGAPSQMERRVKYERLLQIEKEVSKV